MNIIRIISNKTGTVVILISGMVFFSHCQNTAAEPAPVISQIIIQPDSLEIEIGQTSQISAIVTDQTGETMTEVIVQWESLNSEVATVDSAGLVTGISSGNTSIIISAGDVSVSSQVTVYQVDYDLPDGLPDDFPPIFDEVTGNALTGWGGGGGYINQSPIIFIHGNYHTADNWRDVAEILLNFGYVPNEMWAVSYIDFTGGSGANSNLSNLADIENFVSAVLDYTGVSKVAVIGHSLGVTVGRAWMKQYNRYGSVSHFIGIAGANHGVNFCGLTSPSHDTPLCDELGHPQSDFLIWLNGDDETPYNDLVQYMTIYSGTDLDFFYPFSAEMNDGSIMDLHLSPLLDGAFNLQVPMDHMSIRTNMISISEMVNFMN